MCMNKTFNYIYVNLRLHLTHDTGFQIFGLKLIPLAISYSFLNDFKNMSIHLNLQFKELEIQQHHAIHK